MRTADMQALGDVAAEGLSVLNSLVRGTHRGIARRVFTSIGPASRPVEIVHDTIAGTVYDVLDSAGHRIPPALCTWAASGLAFDDDPALDERPGVAEAIAALAGIYGDELAERDSALATPMALRVAGRPVPLTPDGITDAYPRPTDALVVFVHGLCQTESSWRRPPRITADVDPRPYGERLSEDLGFTPIDIRYNTGRHISTNGRDLDAILTRLLEVWPVPVRRIALVGHSMGGLVVRSACHYGHEQNRRWTRTTRQVVCLGSPHLGADLERGVNAAAWVMAKFGESRAVAELLNLRSDGIKDLRYGALLDSDWDATDPDEFLRDRCSEVPFLPGADYHFVATSAAPAAVGILLGDHLVRPSSAAGRGRRRRLPFADDAGLTLTGFHHFDLLNHPEIYAKIRDWLTP
ncbi:alpha/beta fold hydrolase [Mycobacterium sp. 236(2023)]|uniref:esterase/lipase family protein n=1 Tax=Mycobacterium sp. 236(2023) TaxID=3038163 RepID=UPI002414FC09|nr:alpha/beta fold hydrolase [Mycobacterium sp. 236(2023)]MDG4663235.1 alpha/beta fold hydrolase [Mycobacterium sp. 236(2023)]